VYLKLGTGSDSPVKGSRAAAVKIAALITNAETVPASRVLRPWVTATPSTARGGRLHRRRISMPIEAYPLTSFCVGHLPNKVFQMLRGRLVKK
jgi:hypothetical protein